MSHQKFSFNFAIWVCVFLCVIAQQIAANSSESTSIHLETDADETYRRAITSIEKERGAHDFALVEPAIGLGVNFQLKNRHEEAIEALTRALHVNRINRGLHDPDHVPIIDLISHSQVRLGDWESAEKQQQLRFWIYKREIETVENISTELLNDYVDATLHFANWQGQTFAQGTARFPLVKLRQAQLALNDAKERMNSKNLTLDDRYFYLLNASAVNNYHIVVHLSDSEVDPVSGSYAGDQDISDYLLRKNVMMDSYRRGTEALLEVMSITASANQQLQHAMAILNYADWQLLFNRPQTAAKEYQRAHEVFITAGLAKTVLNKRFAEPERISSFNLDPGFADIERRDVNQTSGESVVGKSQQKVPFVLAVFDVTRQGEVRNIDIEESWPHNDRRIKRQARHQLVESKFRPALLDGKPVVSKDVKIRYLFNANRTN